jgi:WhiB family redox-sensing transcriptional regulator
MTALTDLREHYAEDWFGSQESWRALAACRGMDTDIFYPEGRGRSLRAREAIAKEICGSCPVARQCRESATGQPERFGIWGGLTEGERGWSRR